MRRWLCGRARGVIDIRLSAEPLHRQRLGEHACNIFALHLPSHLSPNSSTYGSVTPTSRAPSATGLPRRVVGADRYIATHEQRSALGRDGRQQIPRSRQEYREPDDQTPRRRADRTYRSHERTRCQVGEDRTADAVERALAGRRGEEHCTALEGPATVRISTPAPALGANRGLAPCQFRVTSFASKSRLLSWHPLYVSAHAAPHVRASRYGLELPHGSKGYDHGPKTEVALAERAGCSVDLGKEFRQARICSQNSWACRLGVSRWSR